MYFQVRKSSPELEGVITVTSWTYISWCIHLFCGLFFLFLFHSISSPMANFLAVNSTSQCSKTSIHPTLKLIVSCLCPAHRDTQIFWTKSCCDLVIEYLRACGDKQSDKKAYSTFYSDLFDGAYWEKVFLGLPSYWVGKRLTLSLICPTWLFLM